jgi:hypothetical protein
MADYKEWVVNMVVTTEQEYQVLARTAEEAVSLAEDLFDSGEQGDVLATSIESADAASGDVYAQHDDDLMEEVLEP